MGSLYFQIASLFYIILLIIVYFSKKRLDHLENKIYVYLIFTTLIGIFLDLLSTYIALVDVTFPLLNFICKLYLVYLIAWEYLLVLYAFIITVSKPENGNKQEKLEYNKKTSKIIRTLTILLIIGTISLLILPLKNFSENNIVYTYGLGANFTYATWGIGIITILIITLKKFRTLADKKRFIPMILFITICTGAALLQAAIPSLLIVTSVQAFITFIMFFTIENPDMNMIEQLNIATEQAEKANRAKTDFLANMSHEIRTPLNAIVGFSQALAEENISQEAKEEVNDIIMASNNLLEIVNGILDISKIEANKLEIVNTEYDSNKLMKDVISLTKARLASKPLDFKINIDEGMPEVLYGDHTRVKQIMINILTNAVKYTKEGFIDFTVSTFTQGDICRLIISIEDSGIGIKPEDVDRLFTKFQRFELEKNITTEGTGLGLAITKSLVELMGGKIVVQSKYGQGSKFIISLDQRVVAKTAEELRSEYDDDTTPFNAEGQRIMVVDDNKVNLKVAKRLLRDYHADIDLVLSGQACLDKILNGEKYDLILMDDMMPRMTGTEVLKNLKNIIGFNTPVVALTANAISGMRERYLSLGFDDYLAKPIDKDKMHFILRRYLNESGEYVEKNIEIEDTQDININLIADNIMVRNTDFLEANGIDLTRGLELLGDMETYEMTLEDFYEESKNRLEQLNNYKEKNDMQNYAILVHAMKSDSKYLGFTGLAELSFNHELASKENKIQYIDEHYNELTDEAARIMSIVKKYLGK